MADRMTAVLEPQAPGTPSLDGGQAEPLTAGTAPSVAGLTLDDPAAPFHCGMAMASTPVPVPSLSWASPELDSKEWTCACGFRLDVGLTADSMESVRLASAMVESLQWEMDAAQERFENAVRTAARLGAGPEALGKAAGLTAGELQDILAGGVELHGGAQLP